MDEQRLNLLLGRLKAQRVPATPTNLRQNVWREIRMRKESLSVSDSGVSAFLSGIRVSLRDLVAPALGVTLVMSIGMTILVEQSFPNPDVQKALGLQVFSHQSSPLARLAGNP